MSTPVKKGKKRFNKSFRKRDARHYLIYRELDKIGVAHPYSAASVIVNVLEDNKL